MVPRAYIVAFIFLFLLASQTTVSALEGEGDRFMLHVDTQEPEKTVITADPAPVPKPTPRPATPKPTTPKPATPRVIKSTPQIAPVQQQEPLRQAAPTPLPPSPNTESRPPTASGAVLTESCEEERLRYEDELNRQENDIWPLVAVIALLSSLVIALVVIILLR